MTVNAYNIDLQLNRLNKSLGSYTGVECQVTAPCDILNPVLKLEYNADFPYNYFYIPDFERFYYLTKPAEIDGPIMYISLHCDVLMSWQTDILGSIGTATRSNFSNESIPDKMVMALPSESIQYRQLSEEITGNNYVLIVGGK